MNNMQIPSVYNNQASEVQDEIQRGFITRVYAWMTFGLLVTAAAALVLVTVPGLLMTILAGQFTFLALLGVELVLVMVLSAAVARLSPLMAGLLFIVYAALNGVTMAVILLIYTKQSIAVTFGITACTFGIMTLFGYTTRRDLTRMGSLLIMALVGIVIASLVNLFFRNPAVYWITTYAGILIFIGLVAYDTQKLKKMSLGLGQATGVESDAGQAAAQKASIIGALMLYLDFINLFLLLLRILGKRK